MLVPGDRRLVATLDAGSEGVIVVLNPRTWFTNDDDTVTDLTEFDFDTESGEPVAELEVKFL